MSIEHLSAGLLLGCSQLLLGIGIGKLEFGIIGFVLEAFAGMLSPLAAFVLFPVYVFVQFAFGENRTGTDRNGAGFRIVGCAGPLAGKTCELNTRHPALEFGVESREVRFPPGTPGISRHHCKVILRGTRAYLVDLNSTYGTFIRTPFVRLRPDTEYELKDRTEFCLASGAVVFRIEESGQSSGE